MTFKDYREQLKKEIKDYEEKRDKLREQPLNANRITHEALYEGVAIGLARAKDMSFDFESMFHRNLLKTLWGDNEEKGTEKDNQGDKIPRSMGCESK